MDASVSVFLKLLDAAVHENTEKNIAIFPDWPAIFTLAKNHNVLPLIFEAASEYEDFVNLPNYKTYMTVSRRGTRRSF